MADQIIHGNCWVAYLDILGFKNMLERFRQEVANASEGRRPMYLDLFVKNRYGEVLDSVRRGNAWCGDVVSIAWFSDSFVLFSHDDTLKSLGNTASFAGAFFREAVCREMPLRGALGIGEFYADKEKGIYLGQGLIDAYEYAEAQDWIGLVVTPAAHKAYEQLHDTSNLLSHLGFVEHDVFFKGRSPSASKELVCGAGRILSMAGRAIVAFARSFIKNTPEHLFAYRPTDPTLHGSMLTGVCSMQRLARHQQPKEYERKLRARYERTIDFLRSTPPVI
jgi:hypothetical protein